MQELIKIQKLNGSDVVDSRIIANELGVEHPALIRTIKKYELAIESSFQRVCFENVPFETNGGVQTMLVCFLTEDQSIFVASLSRNSQKVVEFKSKLVQSFSIARKMIHEVKTLTTLDIMEMSLRQMREHESRISNVEVRLNQMEETKQLAIAELSYIERSTNEVPEIGLRLKINQIVRAYVEKTNISYSNIWSSMYSKMLYAYRFNVNGYKKRHKNESNMDIIERENQLDNLFALVSRELV